MSRQINTDELGEVVATAREKLVAESGCVDAIDGACHENAVYLCQYIQDQTSYQPYLRWGAADVRRTFESVEDAEEAGRVHFWVEIPTESTWRYADVFTMKSSPDGLVRGDILLATNVLPEYYRVPSDSLFKYDETISPTDLLSERHYKRLISRKQPVE